MPDGTVIDVTGGWHDAGDQLKYLITASNATARMLLAYELEKNKFSDKVDGLGAERPNGVPDVLDEARWGLDWIFKLHPAPDQLFHQVADDRDHRGFRLPQDNLADYGWGPNGYRPVYFAMVSRRDCEIGKAKRRASPTSPDDRQLRWLWHIASGKTIFMTIPTPIVVLRLVLSFTKWGKSRKGSSKGTLSELLIDTTRTHGPMIWNGLRLSCTNLKESHRIL